MVSACWRRLALLLAVAPVAGCGTTRLTDTQRTATEQLLISNAVDQAVSELDCSCLARKTVFFDPQYLEGSVDRGYLISSLRQHLLASGCILQEDRAKAAYVVEARSGGVGTDRHSLLVGVPQMTVPALVPGQPSQIPEIPFAKKTDQNGVAKLAVFAYNRLTGQPVWQSGVVQAVSTSRDIWFMGAGPFQKGTIRRGTEFAGGPISLPNLGGSDEEEKALPLVGVTKAVYWPDPSLGKPAARQLTELIGAAALGQPLGLTASLQAQAGSTGGGPDPVLLLQHLLGGESKPFVTAPRPPSPANVGGIAETQPPRIYDSGLNSKPDG